MDNFQVLKKYKRVCVLVQLCLTLCDPVDYSPPGSSPWDFLGKNIGMGYHFLL